LPLTTTTRTTVRAVDGSHVRTDGHYGQTYGRIDTVVVVRTMYEVGWRYDTSTQTTDVVPSSEGKSDARPCATYIQIQIQL